VLAAAGRDVEGGTVRQGGLAQERAQVPAAEGRGVGGAAPQGVPAQETRQVLAAAGRGVVGGAAPQGVPAHETRQVPAAAGRGVVGGVGHRRLMQAAPRLALPFREEADDPEEPRVPPHRRDRHVDRRTSLAWHFFSDLHDDSHHARCNLCGGLYATGGGTSNLMEHLLRKHRQNYEDLMRNRGRPAIPQESYGRNHEKKRILDRLLAKFIAKNMQPLCLVEDAGFKEFVAALDPKYNPPCKKTLTNVS